MEDFKLLDGIQLLGKNDEKISIRELSKGKDIVALYFSAHWCPPCRGFTPVLAKMYKELKTQGKKFETIFVSSDSDQQSFDEYYDEMPWNALPYSERDLKSSLSDIYGVSGIPSLVFLDSSGKLITTNGRSLISKGIECYPWNEDALKAFAEKAKLKEKEVADAQQLNGLKVLQRLRGDLGTSFKIDAEYLIEFANFETVGAPTAKVKKGKVFYEIEILELNGAIQQIGWANEEFEIGIDHYSCDGVGDDNNSFAIDGTRHILFPSGKEIPHDYKDGDVVGVAVDFDKKLISFGLNGDWIEGFVDVDFGCSIYPALSAQGGSYKMNFGNHKPLKFGGPDSSYVSLASVLE